MGLFGSILGEIAGGVLNELLLGNNSNNGNYSSATKSILFEYAYFQIWSDVDRTTRNNILYNLLEAIANSLGLKVSKDNRYNNWDIYFQEDIIVSFAISNGKTTVFYGLYGMGYDALTIFGESKETYAEEFSSVLEDLNFTNIRFTSQEIPFNNKKWMDETKRQFLY